MAPDKSLAAEIEAVAERERVRLIAWLAEHQVSTGNTIDREVTADALMADFIVSRLAEIAALQSRAFEDGARKGLSDALAAYDGAARERDTAEAVCAEIFGRGLSETAGIGEIMDRLGAEGACIRCSAAEGVAQTKLIAAVRAALAPNTTEGRTNRA